MDAGMIALTVVLTVCTVGATIALWGPADPIGFRTVQDRIAHWQRR
jgi:hypothetical protein